MLLIYLLGLEQKFPWPTRHSISLMFSLWDTRLDQLPTFHNITLNITKYKLLKSCSIHINLQVTLAIALYFLSHQTSNNLIQPFTLNLDSQDSQWTCNQSSCFLQNFQRTYLVKGRYLSLTCSKEEFASESTQSMGGGT